MTIEIEAVFEAAKALKEEGTEASTRNVQAKLGTKAHSYIPAFTGLWHRRERHLDDAADLPEAFLEEARLLALSLWALANDRADIREELHLREIERLRNDALEREREWTREKADAEKRLQEAFSDISSMNEEIGELKEQLSAVRDDLVEANNAKADAEARRDKAEAGLKNYSEIVRSGAELEKAQMEGAIARAAQLEFENAGLRKQVEDANAMRAEEAARFNMLLKEYVEHLGKVPTRTAEAAAEES